MTNCTKAKHSKQNKQTNKQVNHQVTLLHS